MYLDSLGSNGLHLLKSHTMFLPNNININLPKSSLISIKDLGHLFQRWSLGFGIEEVDSEQFNKKPGIIDNVVLPANGSKRDRIDIIIEEKSGVDTEEHDGETLGTEGVRTDLNSVGNEKAGPCDRVGEAVEDEHCNDGVTSSLNLSSIVQGRANRHSGLH